MSTWYESLKRYQGFPAKGSLAGALVVLDRLKQDYDLNIDSHTAKGGSQIKGASGEAVRRILANFGEKRPFVGEGGRTNRGLRGDIRAILEAIGSVKLELLPEEERPPILEEGQRFLVEKVREFHNRQRLKVVYDPSESPWQFIHDLLAIARQTQREGPVSQYLVGAKLQLRFPDIQVRNSSFSTADMQRGEPGDFKVGNTAFHITVAPMSGVYEKCKRNIQDGLRVYLLVPHERLAGAWDLAESHGLQRKMVVQSIESFVSQNLDELSVFSDEKLMSGFRRLIETYNERVNAVEIDKSLLIDIPPNLQT